MSGRAGTAPGLLTTTLATWLEAPTADAVATTVAGWTSSEGEAWWPAFRRAVVMHGLAPHLAHGPVAPIVQPALPTPLRAWLAAEDARNRARIERLHGELAAILDAAAAGGVEVMPLKGALLTTRPGTDPASRPMADLDLLVRPADRAAMRRLLVGLGYRHEPEANRIATHDVFREPGGGRVAFPEGEHPDNPRRVEVHTEVKRHLWAWVDDDELTPLLWADARPGIVVDRPAPVPSARALLGHVAVHAASDLLVGRGRLVQWLDLATLVGDANVRGLPHPRLAWLGLRLASRAMPASFATADLRSLEPAIPPRLRRWAARVPLDERCGLTAGEPPGGAARWAARWARWRPSPWRLAVAYGDLPLALAVARHAVRAGRVFGRRPQRRRGPTSAR